MSCAGRHTLPRASVRGSSLCLTLAAPRPSRFRDDLSTASITTPSQRGTTEHCLRRSNDRPKSIMPLCCGTRSIGEALHQLLRLHHAPHPPARGRIESSTLPSDVVIRRRPLSCTRAPLSSLCAHSHLTPAPKASDAAEQNNAQNHARSKLEFTRATISPANPPAPLASPDMDIGLDD